MQFDLICHFECCKKFLEWNTFVFALFFYLSLAYTFCAHIEKQSKNKITLHLPILTLTKPRVYLFFIRIPNAECFEKVEKK